MLSFLGPPIQSSSQANKQVPNHKLRDLLKTPQIIRAYPGTPAFMYQAIVLTRQTQISLLTYVSCSKEREET